MPLALATGEWLVQLVEGELDAGRPAEPRSAHPGQAAGLPLEAQALALAERSLEDEPGGPEIPALDLFLSRFRGHVRLILDVASLGGVPSDRAQRRALVESVLLCLAGEPVHGGDDEVAGGVLAAAGDDFSETGWPPADPRDGLPLGPGQLAVVSRLVARLAALRVSSGRLDEVQAAPLLDGSGAEAVLLVEGLAARASAAGPLDARRRRAIRHQIMRLHLPPPLERRAREAVRAPREAAAILVGAPPGLHRFLVTQVLMAGGDAAGAEPAGRDFATRFAAAAGFGEDELPALRQEAAVAARRQRWLLEPSEWIPGEGPAEWGETADELVEKVTQVFQDNLDAIAAEVRQTRELGQLLAKAASGSSLSGEEKVKVKTGLLDLAKAVPALAIFAAPGGMLLLPLLAKLLPFSVLPSAWDDKGSEGGGLQRK